METRKNILVVDDEQNILNALRRSFIISDYNLLTALGGAEALKVLKENQIDLIITDYKMPEMNGVELLREVRKNYPGIFRVILSGYVETEAITKAIGEGIAMAYFKKPWSEYNLLDKLAHIFETIDRIKDKSLFDIFNMIEKLPSIPDIYYELDDMITSGASVKEVCRVIKNDISLTAKILQVGNSVFYGAKDYASLEQVVLMIGTKSIKDIVFVYKMSESIMLENEIKDELSSIFRYGMILNKGAEYYFSGRMEDLSKSIYSNVGLLSTLGRVIVYAYFPERYFQTMGLMIKHGISFTEAELELGRSTDMSNVIAGAFLDLYNMPFDLIDIIAGYHRSMELQGDNREAGALIFMLSDAIDKFILTGGLADNTGRDEAAFLDMKRYRETLNYLNGVLNV